MMILFYQILLKHFLYYLNMIMIILYLIKKG